MGWYVLSAGGTANTIRPVGDKDAAIAAACRMRGQGLRILMIGPFGNDALGDHAIEGAEMREILAQAK
jgi:hypothetical protein